MKPRGIRNKHDRWTKLTFANAKFLPKLAICDPELTLGSPSNSAATGMDAITHCIEAVWRRLSILQQMELALMGCGGGGSTLNAQWKMAVIAQRVGK